MEDKKLEEILNDIKKSVAEDVEKKVLDKVVARKDIFGSNGSNQDDKRQKSAEFIKALYTKDYATLKAMNTTSGEEGGYFVPEYFASEVVRVANQYGVARRNARIWPMTGKVEKVPAGGNVSAYRIAEKGALKSSQPTLKQVTLTAKQVATITPMTNQLLRDANVNVVDYITGLIGEAFAKEEDKWAFLGLDTGEGIFRNADVPVLTLGSGKTNFYDLTFDNLLDAISLMSTGALAGAKWYMHPSVYNMLRKIKGATTGHYLFQEPGGGQPPTIWNYPVEFVDVLPSVADSGANKKFVVFGNLKYMLFGDRGEYEMKISEEATITDTDNQTKLNLFEMNMSAVRVVERIDIQLAEPDKAFVVIKTAAS